LISKSSIEQIFDAAHIEEVVGEFVQLKKAGSSFKGISPWTDEKTPSFFVSPSKGIFKDFSSGKGGNAVSFLMELENMTYPEALRYLAKKYQIEIEETQTKEENREEVSLRESLAAVNAFAIDYFEQLLWETDEGKSIGLSYFRERGYTDQTIKTFALGYSSNENDSFIKAAEAGGYNPEHLAKLGLVKEGEYGKYDFFRGRVMFPIRNISGRPIAFAGRTLRSDNKVKYLNSPESELYDKSNSLYGIFESKRSIIKNDLCCLVEGYTDVISLHQAGIDYAVSSSGTSLTDGQIKLIKRYTSNVSLLYDGDSAGVKAAIRAIDLLLDQGINVKVVLFPENHDPDSYSKAVSSSELERYLKEEALDFSDFMLKVLLQDAGNDPIKKANASRRLVESLALIKDHITRSIYVERASKSLDVPEQALYNELNKILRKNQLKRSGIPDQAVSEMPGEKIAQEKPLPTHDPILYEKEITRVLLKFGNENLIIDLEGEIDVDNSETSDGSDSDESKETQMEVLVGEYILYQIAMDEIEFKSPVCAKIFKTYREHFEVDGSCPSSDRFVRDPDPELSKEIAGMISSPYELSENWSIQHHIYTDTEETDLKRTVFDPLMRLKLNRVKMMMDNLEYALQKASDEQEINNLLKEKMNLDRMKLQLSEFFGSTII